MSSSPQVQNLRPISKQTLASTNARVESDAPAVLGRIEYFNESSISHYLRIFDKATPPVSGVDVPVMRFPVTGPGIALDYGAGVRFKNGVAWCVTTDAGDSWSGAVGAGEGTLNIYLA